MSELKALPVIKDKFWIVQQDGKKIATIQAVDQDGGFVYVHDDYRERFPSVKLLKTKLNLIFEKPERRSKTAAEYEVYGYPLLGKPYNSLFDVSKRLPIYTKNTKSKSYFCAGYYLIKLGSNWTRAYCPKLITVQRYEYRGPYYTAEEQQAELEKLNGK